MIITIGRQYGAGGRELGEKLSQKLKLPLYDRKLVAIISAHLEKGIPLDKLNLTYSNLYGSSSPYEIMMSDIPGPLNDDNYLFKKQENTLKILSEKNSGIFIGRCTNYILKDNKNAYHFFIAADDKYREMRGKNVYFKSLVELKKEDEKRAAFYNYYTGSKWGDPADYDMILNMGRIDMAKAIELIIDYIEK